MYAYAHPRPIEISLCDAEGFELREKVAEHLRFNENTTGAQRANRDRQGFGLLAEMVIRHKLGMPLINAADHSLGHDIKLPSGVRVDVKCRGGKKRFLEEYVGGDELPRESKHNFFARQVHDQDLDSDIYLMAHLFHPADPSLPGGRRQRSWILYVCGWVSKKRVIREGVYLPPGAISERGREWFPYQYQQIEFYNKNLNGLAELRDLLTVEPRDVASDEEKKGDLNLTRVDTLRIGYDLLGRGVLLQRHLDYIREQMSLNGDAGSFLHNNQSLHVLKWLHEKGIVTASEYETMLCKLRPEIKFEGLGR